MRIKIQPYKKGSQSARALATALVCKVLHFEGSKFKEKPDDVIINWGCSRNDTRNCKVVNPPHLVEFTTNKLFMFNKFQGLEVMPQFWTKDEDIPDDAFPIVCRTILTGHSGAGIVIAEVRSDLVPAPLYVRYVKKSKEFRVHLGLVPSTGGTSIITVQQKVARADLTPIDWRVRSLHNGFIFQRNDIDIPEQCLKLAGITFNLLGLDFGAVDVIYNAHYDKAYVLEVNTAPGLVGETVNDYAKFFKENYV